MGKLVKKTATNVLKNPGRALEITSNIATAAATMSTKAALSSLPEVINFNHTRKRFYMGKIVKFFLYKRNQKTDRLYPSAPFENKIIDLEQRYEKRVKDAKSFNNSINDIEKMITYLKDKNNKEKRHSESADPEKALGPSDILDRNLVVDISDRWSFLCLCVHTDL